MSVPEHTPATEATPALEQSSVPKAVSDTENTHASPHPEATSTAVGGEPTPVPGKDVAEEPLKKDEALVEATPASEGTLGYKAPGLFKQFRFVKHYFWFSDEPLKPEQLSPYIRDEKVEVAHPNAAWAQETGKGVLFFTKRSEDKATPQGLIMLSDVTDVTKDGTCAFTFKAGNHVHKFEAANQEERASWIVAVEKKAEEAKGIAESITGSEGYKKTLENYVKSPALFGTAAATASKSTSRPAKKSLDASVATSATAPTTNGSAKETDGTTEEEQAKDTKSKSRSQSRKRGSIFGTLRGKKEEKDEAKEIKKDDKAEDKEDVKEHKKEEAQIKKEEAKRDHDSNKAKEAVEAAAVAAAPAVAVAAEKKHEDKVDEKNDATTPTDKKGKRNSVFGSLFGKKGVTSPTTEKSEKEAGPIVPAKDSENLPVSENAPKLEEPVQNKPIDTAAVIAPADTVSAPAADETAKEPTTAPAETSTATKTEEKGGFLGFIKKEFGGKKEHKEEKKEEVAAETISKDPVVAAAPTETPTATETAAPTTAEERPAREKRRTSLFNLGTIRKKSTENASEDATSPVEKREKSPLPQKLTGLFRRPSKAVKSPEETAPVTETTNAVSPEATTNGETAETSAAVPEQTESKIVGDVVPDNLHTTIHDQVTGAPEVKTSA